MIPNNVDQNETPRTEWIFRMKFNTFLLSFDITIIWQFIQNNLDNISLVTIKIRNLHFKHFVCGFGPTFG